MIGKVITAMVGSKLAEKTPKLSGPAGAALGFAVPIVLRRLSLPAMIALGAGGYAYKKFTEKNGKSTTEPTTPTVAPSAT